MTREPSVFPVAPATVFPADSKPGVPDGLCDQRGAPMSTPDHDSIARESLQAENESLLARATQAEQERDAANAEARRVSRKRNKVAAERDRLRTALQERDQAEQERDAAEAARDEVFAVIERQHVQSSDQQVNEELHAARAEVVALRTALEEIEAHPVARLSVRAAALSIIARAALGSTTEPEETQTERIRGTTGRYPFPLVEESHTEPEETRGEADDVGRRPPTTTPNPSHMEARGGRPWDIFKREAQ